MRKILVLGFGVAFVAACADTPTQLPDVEAQFGVAGNGNGAVVTTDADHVSGCYTYLLTLPDPPYEEYEQTECEDYRYSLNRVETPSGNNKYTYNEKGVFTTTNTLGYTEVKQRSYQKHWLKKIGADQNETWAEKYVARQWWEGGAVNVCTFTENYHFANGKVTRWVTDYVCAPE